jgi:hypothetical protein
LVGGRYCEDVSTAQPSTSQQSEVPDKEVQTHHPFCCTSARWEIMRTKRDEPFVVGEMLADEPYIVWRGGGCKLEYSIVKTTS